MSTQLWWYVARSTGYVAWALVSASVISGLLLATRITHGRPRPAWTLDLHRFLGGAAVAFSALHVAGLVADTYVSFGWADVLVPWASRWKPGAVALGVVGLYLLAAVEISSLLMRRLPKRAWRAIHLLSYLLFWSATFHLLAAGTDADNPVSRVAVVLVIVAVVFLSLVRILSGRGRAGARRRRPLSDRSPTAPAMGPSALRRRGVDEAPWSQGAGGGDRTEEVVGATASRRGGTRPRRSHDRHPTTAR